MKDIKYDICKTAAEKGDLESYAWNEWTCANAALNGHLDCLRYAHENGCPWNEVTILFAAENGHLNCLRYAHENGCA